MYGRKVKTYFLEAPFLFFCFIVTSLSSVWLPFHCFLTLWSSSSCEVAHFQVCDAIDQEGDALCFILLWVLVQDEQVMGMLQLSDVLLIVVVVDVDVDSWFDSWFDSMRPVSRYGSHACGI